MYEAEDVIARLDRVLVKRNWKEWNEEHPYQAAQTKAHETASEHAKSTEELHDTAMKANDAASTAQGRTDGTAKSALDAAEAHAAASKAFENLAMAHREDEKHVDALTAMKASTAHMQAAAINAEGGKHDKSAADEATKNANNKAGEVSARHDKAMAKLIAASRGRG